MANNPSGADTPSRGPNAPQSVELKINIPEDVAQGVYVNLAMIHNNRQEFTFDFIFVQPVQQGQNKADATVRARIISSPQHTKRLLMALVDNVKRYEDQFGEIQLPDKPAGNSTAMH